MNFEKEILAIKERNKLVEGDKAWEISFLRRALIVVFTYVLAFLFMYIANLENPWLGAFVPSIGYLISTFSVPGIKKLWIKKLSK